MASFCVLLCIKLYCSPQYSELLTCRAVNVLLGLLAEYCPPNILSHVFKLNRQGTKKKQKLAYLLYCLYLVSPVRLMKNFDRKYLLSTQIEQFDKINQFIKGLTRNWQPSAKKTTYPQEGEVFFQWYHSKAWDESHCAGHTSDQK